MHRLVIKGRKIMERKMVDKASKHKIVDLNQNKVNDDYNMLYYDYIEDN
jgi:hypothetical protein